MVFAENKIEPMLKLRSYVNLNKLGMFFLLFGRLPFGRGGHSNVNSCKGSFGRKNLSSFSRHKTGVHNGQFRSKDTQELHCKMLMKISLALGIYVSSHNPPPP